MTNEQISYLVFGIVLVLALLFDMGMLSKKSKVVTLKTALWQSIFWLAIGLGFGIFVWFELGQKQALEYLSAYLMEKSLSIDNIFVFVLLFNFFRIKESQYARVLLIGVLLAIVFRVIFITIGVELVNRFHWLMYVFGAFLLYTGIKMFSTNTEEEYDPANSRVYKLIRRIFPLTLDDHGGKYIVKENGKTMYTMLFMVVVMVAATDIVFAVDSIPAVMGISRHVLVIYTSNIFAVLGLRALFFLLREAVTKFSYLQQGVALVLVFIGCKMLAEIFHVRVPTYVSLLVIVLCILASIIYSIQVAHREEDKARANAAALDQTKDETTNL